MIVSHFVELGAAYLLAAMMPGPSVALIIRNGMLHSRLAGMLASLGTIVGAALQSGCVILGLIFIDRNPILFKFIRVLCSTYLIYLGFKTLLSRKAKGSKVSIMDLGDVNAPNLGYFIEGFLVEFLNPLAFTFFLSIMTVIITPQEFWHIKVAYWLEIVVLSSIWFLTVAFTLSSEKITFYTRKFNKVLEKLAGTLFVVFGSRMFVW